MLTGTQATRLCFEGRRCVGVEVLRGGVRKTVRARREVILAAGAVASPHLLQLSGIGPASLLQSLQLPLVADLPGVGSNLQDHLQLRMAFKVTSQPIRWPSWRWCCNTSARGVDR